MLENACCFLFSLSPITPQTLVLNSYELLRPHFLFICALYSLDVASIQDAPGTHVSKRCHMRHAFTQE